MCSDVAGFREAVGVIESCDVLPTRSRRRLPECSSAGTAEDLWQTYTHLSDAEAAFRIHKTDLSIRPIWHQRTDRVLAHILVCFPAYGMWEIFDQWQSRAELGNSPRTILQELAAIPSADVVLPTATTPPRELPLRCVVRADKAQAALLDRLGPRLPERLRAPLAQTKM